MVTARLWRGAWGAYLQQHAAVGVHVGPGVLGLALLQQHVGDDLVELGHQFEHGVVGKVLHGELPLAGVTRVGLPQDGVPVTGDHLAETPESRVSGGGGFPRGSFPLGWLTLPDFSVFQM